MDRRFPGMRELNNLSLPRRMCGRLSGLRELLILSLPRQMGKKIVRFERAYWSCPYRVKWVEDYLICVGLLKLSWLRQMCGILSDLREITDIVLTASNVWKICWYARTCWTTLWNSSISNFPLASASNRLTIWEQNNVETCGVNRDRKPQPLRKDIKVLFNFESLVLPVPWYPKLKFTF